MSQPYPHPNRTPRRLRSRKPRTHPRQTRPKLLSNALKQPSFLSPVRLQILHPDYSKIARGPHSREANRLTFVLILDTLRPSLPCGKSV
nr:hypothetical protein [uncultured bacterium]